MQRVTVIETGTIGPPGNGSGASLPDGGTTGQVLTKESNTNGDADWEDAGESLPGGGTTGQVLTKESNTDGDADWETLPAGVSLPIAESDVTNLVSDLAGKQPLDSDLTAIAALSTTAFGRALLALADAAAGRTSFGLGTAAVADTSAFDAAGAAAAAQAASQPVDSDLTAIAALTTTAYGRAFLALADAAAGRTALGLGTAATHATGDYDAAGAAAAAQAASQPLDSDLTAIAALTTTSFGRGLLAAANAAALGITASDVGAQPLDSDLTAIAALTTTSFGRGLLAAANAAALGITASDVGAQPLDSDLTAIAALTTTSYGRALLAVTNLAGLQAIIGTSGTPSSTTFLRGDGSWQTPSGTADKLGLTPTAVKTANYSVVAGDYARFDTTSGALVASLPSGPADGTVVGVKVVKPNPVVNAVTVNCGGSDVFNYPSGATSTTLSVTGHAVMLLYKSSDVTWTVVATDVPKAQMDLIYAPIATTGFQGLYAAQQQARDAANAGYFMCAPGKATPLYVPSGTAGKLDRVAGAAWCGEYGQVTLAAVTAISTTITSLADGTNPRWCWVEVDNTGTTQFNNGTAAATPTVPTPTVGRVPGALIYIPAAATAVDALTATNNGLAKLFDLRELRPVTPDGWSFENDATFVFAHAGTNGSTAYPRVAATGDITSHIYAGTKLSWNDGTGVRYAVVGASALNLAAPLTSVTTTVGTSLFTKNSHGMGNGTPVVPTGLVNTTGFTNGTIYFVSGATTNTFQLAATYLGTAITMGGTADSSVVITGAALMSLFFNDDYPVSNATYTAVRYSNVDNPAGFPAVFNWTPTLSGWASNPTSVAYQYTTRGKWAALKIRQSGQTTSNATSHTATLPFVAAAGSDSDQVWAGFGGGFDNSAATVATVYVVPSGTVANLCGNGINFTNTASGTNCIKSADCWYQFG